MLLGTAAIVFVIACSNVANLIGAVGATRGRARGARRARGQSRGIATYTLAESLVLCAAGALAGLYLADPLVALMSRYAARYPFARLS